MPQHTGASSRSDVARATAIAGADSGLVWGVGAVAIRLGIATPTLRTWERRYGLGPSHRTEGGHRRYSEDDIGRVQLMGRLVGEGVPAQSAARVVQSLDSDELWDALGPPVNGTGPAGPGERLSPQGRTTPALAVDTIVAAARAHDAAGLTTAYAAVLADFGVAMAWTTILVPALRRLGELWASGEVGVEVEHLASRRLSAQLHAYVGAHAPPVPDAHPIVLAGAADDLHTLPLDALEASLAASGVGAHSLGPRVPPETLVGAIQRIQPTAVFWWASMADERLTRDLASVARLERPTHLLLGGPGWASTQVEGSDAAERVHDLPSAVHRLLELRATA